MRALRHIRWPNALFSRTFRKRAGNRLAIISKAQLADARDKGAESVSIAIAILFSIVENAQRLSTRGMPLF